MSILCLFYETHLMLFLFYTLSFILCLEGAMQIKLVF